MGWYDAKAKFGGWHYVSGYVQDLTHEGLPHKVGIGALVAVLSRGYSAFDELFWILIIMWAADMVTGTARAFRDPKEILSWGRATDGLVRLVILVVFPPLMALAEMFLARVTGLDPAGKLMLFAMGVLVMQELLSITRNVEYFYPGVRKLRGKLISWREGEQPTVERAEVLLIDSEEEEGGP